jgi:hypothetical protein
MSLNRKDSLVRIEIDIHDFGECLLANWLAGYNGYYIERDLDSNPKRMFLVRNNSEVDL